MCGCVWGGRGYYLHSLVLRLSLVPCPILAYEPPESHALKIVRRRERESLRMRLGLLCSNEIDDSVHH